MWHRLIWKMDWIGETGRDLKLKDKGFSDHLKKIHKERESITKHYQKIRNNGGRLIGIYITPLLIPYNLSGVM